MTQYNPNGLVPIDSKAGQLAPLQQAVSGSLQIKSMDDLSRLAKMMAASGFFDDCREAAQAGVKILAGLELGFPAFSSLTGIHIIKGKPAIGANLMAAAIKKSGRYNYRVLEHSTTVCRIAFFEQGEQVGISEFTVDEARIMGTQNMHKFPKNMLFARAMSNGVKWYCPDIFLGAPVYTPDELGVAVDGDGNILDVSAQLAPYTPPVEPLHLAEPVIVPIPKKNGTGKLIVAVCEAIAENAKTAYNQASAALGISKASKDLTDEEFNQVVDEILLAWAVSTGAFIDKKDAKLAYEPLIATSKGVSVQQIAQEWSEKVMHTLSLQLPIQEADDYYENLESQVISLS